MAEFSFYGNQAIVSHEGKVITTSKELVESHIFKKIVEKYLEHLREKDGPRLAIFEGASDDDILEVLQLLAEYDRDEIIKKKPEFKRFFDDLYNIDQFVEELYNFWRSFERFYVCHSFEREGIDERPYRTFNSTVEHLNDLVRKVYRDMRENVTRTHPRMYRQMAAGFQVGIIAKKKKWPCAYENIKDIPLIRQVLIVPPLILDPLMNKRTGRFMRVDRNPIENMKFNKEWLCFPAKVGSSLIHIYFHQKFIGLGASTGNLFELAEEEDLKKKPDAIYAFGVDEDSLKQFDPNNGVFYDDKENNCLVAALSRKDEYGYFGYLKKLVLTLHNISQLKKGLMPVHGAMVRIELKNGKAANIIIVGDTGAGKSESLEAFRILADEHIRRMIIIFDDMGSVEWKDGKLLAYGTESGAFVRLDDLQPGFAFGQIDRSIIMSPQKINARAIIPITTLQEILHGYEVDYFLYANNYEEVKKGKEYLEDFKSVDEAIRVFRQGKRMSKGTTTEVGITESYFANPFGPEQYKELNEKIAAQIFKNIFGKVRVAQLRTQLGIKGMEFDGPKKAAEALFKIIGN